MKRASNTERARCPIACVTSNWAARGDKKRDDDGQWVHGFGISIVDPAGQIRNAVKCGKAPKTAVLATPIRQRALDLLSN
jgi:hypothetical protein